MKPMRTMAIEEFLAHFDDLIENIPAEGILVLREGKPLAKIVPARVDNSHLIGIARGMEIKGDIFSTEITWDAERPADS